MSFVTSSVALEREQLILAHLPQVHLLANRMRRRCPYCVELDDLVSAGTVGLIQAVDRFQPELRYQLKTFAERRIRGAILDYLRRLDPLPRSVRRFIRQRDEASIRFEQQFGRRPNEVELAEALGLTVERYRRLLVTVRASQTLSLDAETEAVQALKP